MVRSDADVSDFCIYIGKCVYHNNLLILYTDCEWDASDSLTNFGEYLLNSAKIGILGQIDSFGATLPYLMNLTPKS
ncbi:MAG: hypothetical protein KJ043_21300, partial [Anaerolineae bacterium]|nr:hypothetical protein [Anaerolineae bacterium]